MVFSKEKFKNKEKSHTTQNVRKFNFLKKNFLYFIFLAIKSLGIGLNSKTRLNSGQEGEPDKNPENPKSNFLYIEHLEVEGRWMFVQHRTSQDTNSSLAIIFDPVNFTKGTRSGFSKKFDRTKPSKSMFKLKYFKASQDLWTLDEFGDPEVYLMLVYSGIAESYTYKNVSSNGRVEMKTFGYQLVSYFKLGRSKKGTYLRFRKSMKVSLEDIELTWGTHFSAALSKGIFFGGILPSVGTGFRFVFFDDRQESSLSQKSERAGGGVLPAGVAVENVVYQPSYLNEGYQFVKGATVNKFGVLEFIPVLIYADFETETIGVSYIRKDPESGKAEVVRSKMFAIHTQPIGQAFKIECGPERRFNVSADQLGVKDLKPNHVAFSCFYSVIGSFDFLIRYELLLDQNFGKNETNVLVSSRMVYNIVTPDSFRDQSIQTIPGSVILKMYNEDLDIKIKESIPSQCPRIVVVYKADEDNYPWAIYSCKDLNITNNEPLPLITTYYYDLDYLWITKTIFKLEEDDPKTNSLASIFSQQSPQSGLYSTTKLVEGTQKTKISRKEFSVITVHGIKNSTLIFLREFSFENVSITLKSLNQNIMLTKLGMITQILQTPFILSSPPNKFWFFLLILIGISVVCYIQCQDLSRTKLWRYLIPSSKIPALDIENESNGQNWENMMLEGDEDEDLADLDDSGDPNDKDEDGGPSKEDLSKTEQRRQRKLEKSEGSDYDVDGDWEEDDSESSEFESSSEEPSESEPEVAYNFDEGKVLKRISAYLSQIYFPERAEVVRGETTPICITE